MHPNCLSNFRLGHRVHQRVLVLLGLWICLCTTNPIHAWQDDESDRSRRPPTIPKTSPNYDIRPASFKDLTPGQATLQDVTRTLGQAASRFEHQGETTLRYAIDPYSRVEVVIADNVVASIVFYLKEASPRDVLVKKLGLSEFRPTPIPDEHGIPLGQAYPERGVLFGFVPGDKKLHVAQIILEPIGAEPFVYRVLHDMGRSYQDQLRDLEQANQLDSKNALSHWLKANILGRIGRQMDALSSARVAARLDPKNLDYKLTLAWLLADVDRNRALAETKAIIKAAESSPVTKARAEYQLGYLSDDKAIDRHIDAIQTAIALTDEDRVQVRRAAKRVLFDAHLAVASEIAWGNYRRKREVVQKWLDRASRLADDLIQHEQHDEFLKLQVARATLATKVAMGAVTDPTKFADRVVENGGVLFKSATDPLFRAQIQWEVTVALLHAAQLEITRREYQSAIDYAEAGLKIFSSIEKTRQTSHEQDYVVGRLYFLIGYVSAIHKNDHQTAVKWYTKAGPLLSNNLPVLAKHDLPRHADRFVSMGVSYWHSDAKDKAIRLTEQGAELLEVAVAQGKTTKNTLAIPYGNLANMQHKLGRENEANRFAAKAAKARSAAKHTQQR